LSAFDNRRRLLARIGLAIGLAGLGAIAVANGQERLTSVASGVALGSAPVTVALDPQPRLADALRADDDAPIVLAIEGIEGTAAQPVRINVFLNKPDADRAVSSEDASAVGFIQLLPVRGAVRRIGHAFEIPRSLRLQPSSRLQVTLVPVIGVGEAPEGVALRIERIYLRLAR
jgi:hypothetical protein